MRVERERDVREQRRVSKESGCKGKERMRQREGQREREKKKMKETDSDWEIEWD